MNIEGTVAGLDNRDNIVSSLARFLLELVAWIAGPWAVFAVYGWPGAAIALVGLVALPAVFSTRGDKKHVIIPTPGPIRLLIEFFLFAVAGYAAWQVWPIEAAWAVWGVIGVGVLAGMPRSIWLLRGAPARG